jgi:hypothetical protein
MDGWKRLSCLTLALSASAISLCACNAGQGDDTTVSVQGNWSGSYSAEGSQAPIAVFGLVQEDGPAYLYDSTGVVYVLPRFTGSVKLAGPVTAFPAMGYTFADGSSSMPLDMSGTADDAELELDLDAATSQGQSGQAELAPLETYSGKPSVIASGWSGYYLSPTPTALAITADANGNLSGNDAYGCTLQGGMRQLDADSTLFAVTLQSTGSSPACGGSFTGIAHESPYDTFGLFQGTEGIYYYLCASNSTTAFVAVLRAQ